MGRGRGQSARLGAGAVARGGQVRRTRRTTLLPTPTASEPVIERYLGGGHSEQWRREADGQLHRLDGPALRLFNAKGRLYEEQWHHEGQLHRENAPALFEYDDQGVVCGEHYYRQSKLHREDGPASVERITKWGITTTRESYYREGELHRDGRPAVIEDRSDGVHREHYYRHGERDREDGPAVIERSQVGGPLSADEWWRHGELHRDDGPAVVRYWSGADDEPPVVYSEEWRRNGAKHRDGAPARLTYTSGGELTEAEWWRDGVLHRGDGPAHWEKGPHQQKATTAYYLDGVRVSKYQVLGESSGPVGPFEPTSDASAPPKSFEEEVGPKESW